MTDGRRRGGDVAGLRHSRLGRWPAPATRQVIVLVAALLAFLSQTILIHAHVHTRTVSAVERVAAATTVYASVAHDTQAPGDSDDCPICKEQAYAGTYLLPAANIFIAPVRQDIRTETVFQRGSTPARTSHDWRSRAPPRDLQA